MSRFRVFLAISAALIAVVVVAAGLLVGGFFARHVLSQEETQTAEIVRNQAHQHLTAQDFDSTAVQPQNFQAFLEGLPGVFRIKAFDRTGRIVWSNEPQLIGRTFPDNTYLLTALQGRVTTVLEAPQRTEHVFEKEKRYVAEAYVPVVFPGSPQPAGVIETYKDMTAVLQDLQRTQRRIWTVAGAMGLSLYVALGLVVWKASASELRAMRRLEAQNQEIGEAHERLAAILAGVADRMLIVDRQMRIVWMNPAGAAAIGAGTVGQMCSEVMGAGPEACDGCPAVKTFQTGRVERGVRAEPGPGGRTRYLDLVTAPLRDAAGEIHQVLEVTRDITELVEMEERVKEANQALLDAQAQLVEKERLAAVGQVVVGLHHAILNPLTGVLGALQVLKQSPFDAPKTARAVAEAEEQVRKIERLIKSLPDLRRAAGAPYVGETTMLDLERSCGEEDAHGAGEGDARPG